MIVAQSKRKNFSWNIAGTLIYAGLQWCILMLLARWGSPSDVGYYTLALAITAPIALLCNLQLRTAQVTDQSRKFSFNEYLKLRNVSNVIFCFGIVGVSFLYSSNTFYIIALVGLIKMIENTSEVIYGYYHRNQDLVFASKSKIFKITISVSFFIIAFWQTRNLVPSLIVYAVMYILTFYIYDYKTMLKIKKKELNYKSTKIKELLIWTLPLGIASLLTSLNVNMPRIILEKYISLEAIGYYAAIAYILYSGSIIINSLGQVFSPKMSKFWVLEEYGKFYDILFKMLLIALLIGGILIISVFFWGDFILILFYGVAYGAHKELFLMLSIGSIFIFFATYLGFAITATGNFKHQPYIIGLLFILNGFVSFIFIKNYGLIGAAYANILISIVTCMLQLSVFIWIVLKKTISVKF